jgi:DNA mismatch endonuclease (patch repair protein)
MADVFSPAKRSAVMACIRSAGNRTTELRLIEILREHGVKGWRRGVTLEFTGLPKRLRVRPDFVFRRHRLAVFVDGCFWHACPYHRTKPRTNRAFWSEKIAANRKRDRIVGQGLASAGWRVLRIWEHSLIPKRSAMTVQRLQRHLTSVSGNLLEHDRAG